MINSKKRFLQHHLVKGAWSSIFKTTKQKHCQNVTSPHTEERIHQENDKPLRRSKHFPLLIRSNKSETSNVKQVLSLKVTPRWCSCCCRLWPFCCSRWSCCGWWRSRSFEKTSAPSDTQRWLRWAPSEPGAPRRTSGRCWWGSEDTQYSQKFKKMSP